MILEEPKLHATISSSIIMELNNKSSKIPIVSNDVLQVNPLSCVELPNPSFRDIGPRPFDLFSLCGWHK